MLSVTRATPTVVDAHVTVQEALARGYCCGDDLCILHARATGTLDEHQHRSDYVQALMHIDLIRTVVAPAHRAALLPNIEDLAPNLVGTMTVDRDWQPFSPPACRSTTSPDSLVITLTAAPHGPTLAA